MNVGEVQKIVAEDGDVFEKISDSIWEFAEIRYREFQSADLLCKTLEDSGFRVTRPVAGIETAFVGEYGSGKPVIGFLGEFDALPELSQVADGVVQEPALEGACGHGCGHHLLGVGSLEAACAVKKLIEQGKITGTVRYYGCPAEESGAGKGFMVRANVFEDADICLTWHPMDTNGVMNHTLANMRFIFKFHGVSAHASANPHMGRSALDALELTNVGCNYLREHIIPEARIHYAVTNTGGTAPNVVQCYAEEIYCIRAPRQDQLEAIYKRVCNVARGAVLMTDTSLDIQVVSAYANIVPNHTLGRLALDKMKAVGTPEYTDEDMRYASQYQSEDSRHAIHTEIIEKNAPFSGSTDVGDVSWNVPTLSLGVTTYAAGTVLHSWRSTAQGKSRIAKKGMHFAACVLAAVAADLYENRELRENVRRDFESELGGRVYRSLLPTDAKPGDF